MKTNPDNPKRSSTFPYLNSPYAFAFGRTQRFPLKNPQTPPNMHIFLNKISYGKNQVVKAQKLFIYPSLDINLSHPPLGSAKHAFVTSRGPI